MCSRMQELLNLDTYIKDVDNEITLILQNLQWDRSRLLSDPPIATCDYNKNHILPADKKAYHENHCRLRIQGYTEDDKLLSEPLNDKADTIVKLCPEDIKVIIENAAKNDPNFKKVNTCHVEKLYLYIGEGGDGPVPQTLDRIQATYTVDERRAIYDAVVASVPACHDLSDLALLDGNAVTSGSKTKSRLEILAELRDMKRRRTKYRVAAKTQNYSDVLRDVIKTQMELYTEAKNECGDVLNSKSQTGRSSDSVRNSHDPECEVPLSEEKSSRAHKNEGKRSSNEIKSSRSRHRSSSRESYLSGKRSKQDVSVSYDREKHREYKREKTNDKYGKYDTRKESRDRSERYYDRDNDRDRSRRNKYDRDRRDGDDKDRKYYKDRDRDYRANRKRDHEYGRSDEKYSRRYDRNYENSHRSQSRDYRQGSNGNNEVRVKHEDDHFCKAGEDYEGKGFDFGAHKVRVKRECSDDYIE